MRLFERWWQLAAMLAVLATGGWAEARASSSDDIDACLNGRASHPTTIAACDRALEGAGSSEQRGRLLEARGQHYLASSKYHRALADLSKAVLLAPQRASAFAYRGEVHRKLGKLWPALQDLDHAVRADPRNVFALSRRGEVHRMQGNSKQALDDFNRALGLDPNHAFSLAGRGIIHRIDGNYGQAIADFDRALLLSPRDDFAFGWRGEVYRAMGDYERAIEDFDQALSLNPQSAHTFAVRGAARRQLDDDYGALQDLDRALAINPEVALAYVERGAIAARVGDHEQAQADFREALRIAPNNAAAYAERGVALQLQGETTRALESLDRAIAIAPDLDVAYRYRAGLYQEMGETDRAFVDLQNAIRARPDVAENYLALARHYEAEGDRERTIAALDNARKVGANPAQIQRITTMEARAPQQTASEANGHVNLQSAVNGPASREDVRWVQSRLNALGHDAGPVDGLMGPKTREAVRQFQRVAGLGMDGRIGDELVAAIKAHAEAERSSRVAAGSSAGSFNGVRVAPQRQRVADPSSLGTRRDEGWQEKNPTVTAGLDIDRPVGPNSFVNGQAAAAGPVIKVPKFVRNTDATITIEGAVSSPIPLASLRIGKRRVPLDPQGRFTIAHYLPEGESETVELVALDERGNRGSAKVEVTRLAAVREPVTYDPPNPGKVRGSGREDAVALVIGIADYNEPIQDALFADRDAAVFKDYAQLALGIPRQNIIHVPQEKASLLGVLEAVHGDLARRVVPGRSEVFVFFAGHGLSDGSDRFLMPRNASTRLSLLPDTSLSRERLIDDLERLKPTRITMFLDTCYTGETRGGGTLCETCRFGQVRLEPAEERPNVTVIAAAGDDEVSVALEDQRHGLFSYWLFKGFEGNADLNDDRVITAGEMHEFLQRHVPRHSLSRQTPTLEGDPETLLVRLH